MFSHFVEAPPKSALALTVGMVQVEPVNDESGTIHALPPLGKKPLGSQPEGGRTGYAVRG